MFLRDNLDEGNETMHVYDIIEQLACLTQVIKFYIALIAGSRRPVRYTL